MATIRELRIASEASQREVEHVWSIVETQKKEIARLRAALKPFAYFAAFIEKEHPGWYHSTFYWNVGRHKMKLEPFIGARGAYEQ